MSLTVYHCRWLSHTVSASSMELVHVYHCLLWLVDVCHCLIGLVELLHVSH